MTDFAVSDALGLNVVDESTWGITPTSPALQALRLTGESLNFNTTFTSSEEIRSDRMQSDTTKTSQQGGGDINGELSYDTYDLLLKSAFHSTWVTTGTDISASTDIGLNLTAGTPNIWALESTITDFTTKSLTVGQFLYVTGFSSDTAFFAQITSVGAHSVGIVPMDAGEIDDAAGDTVTVTCLDFIRNGTSKRSLTVQKVFSNLSTVVYQNFVGSRVNTWTLETATGGLIKTTFGLIAKDATMATSQFASATVTAANTRPVMNAVENVAAVVFDNDPSASEVLYYNNLKTSLDNNLRGQMAIGNLGLIGIEAGKLKVTGSAEFYFSSKALFDKYRAATAFSLSFVLTDALGNTYILTLPRSKFTKMEITAGGSNQDIFAKSDFEALINTAGTYQIQLSKYLVS